VRNAYNIALFLEKKGFTPIISLISPYRDLRDELKQETIVLEFYIFTSEIRGREHFFAKDYEKPLGRYLSIDTTNRDSLDVADDIAIICNNELFRNLLIN
jgi:adenylylsulfate kinase